MSISVTALMPMRHVSERVPGKNYRLFCGRPLYHHALTSLLEVPEVSRVVIDTDSPWIIEDCASRFPQVVCIDRPEALRGGEVPMTAILRHDADVHPSDWYLQTHSTNPLLRSSTISSAIGALEEGLALFDSLFSVNRLQTRLYDAVGQPINHDPGLLVRTQDLPPVYEENSNLYIFTSSQIADGNRFGRRPMMFEMDPLESVDIDEEADFVLAEALYTRREEGSR